LRHADRPLYSSVETLTPTMQPPNSQRQTAVPSRLAALFRLVPIRSLAPRHRQRIADHLLALEPQDRYLRFGYPASDEQVRKYADTLNFERDEVFGIFNRRLQLIAMAHLAYTPEPQLPNHPAMAEFGVSVAKSARGKGYGARLFDHAVMHARNRDIDTLFIHALSENTAMLKIARRAGAKVERDGTESQAFLKLPEDTLATQMSEVIEEHAAEMNYRLKVHARRFDALLDAVAEVKAAIGTTKSGAGRE
jgi:RimJ/RimL family protein N-acetyltransferase